MAVFLLKAEHGLCYTPPPCTGVFTDVPCSSNFAPWIERMAAEGITGGCGGGDFCPTNPCARDQMAVFLLKGARPLRPAGLRGRLRRRRLPIDLRELDRAARGRKHHGRLRRRQLLPGQQQHPRPDGRVRREDLPPAVRKEPGQLAEFESPPQDLQTLATPRRRRMRVRAASPPRVLPRSPPSSGPRRTRSRTPTIPAPGPSVRRSSTRTARRRGHDRVQTSRRGGLRRRSGVAVPPTIPASLPGVDGYTQTGAYANTSDRTRLECLKIVLSGATSERPPDRPASRSSEGT